VDDRVVRRRERENWKEKKKNGGTTVGGGFGGSLGMETWRGGLVGVEFFTKPSNFGVETHMEVFAGVALIVSE
jgi:hypothetical protein